MIVWSGWGFVSVLIFLLGLLLGAAMGNAGLPEGYAIGIGLLIGAAGNWFAGQALNDPARGRELIDAKTGQRVIYRPNHSLFWVPIQWWSVVAAIGGLIFIVTQATGNYHPSPRRADATTPAYAAVVRVENASRP